MRFSLFLVAALFTFSLSAQDNFGFLKPEDQKYFQNDSLEGKNKFERIDANVREINKLHAMVAELKVELQRLKLEVEELKKRK